MTLGYLSETYIFVFVVLMLNVWLTVNNQLCRTWKESGMAQIQVLPSICLEELKKKSSHSSWSSGQDSNQAPPWVQVEGITTWTNLLGW